MPAPMMTRVNFIFSPGTQNIINKKKTFLTIVNRIFTHWLQVLGNEQRILNFFNDIH